MQLRDVQPLGRHRSSVVINQLVHDSPVEIVGSEGQSGLSNLFAQHDPIRFYVGEVIEHQTAQGNRSQVGQPRRLLEMRQARVLGMKRERNHRLEPAGFVL